MKEAETSSVTSSETGSSVSVKTFNKNAANTHLDDKTEKRRIMKNIFVISLAFLLNFTAFQGLSRLQSSLHREENMGVKTQSILYGALMLSCMFLPKIIIHLIGHRWTIAVSFSGYILYMAANGYAVWGTMITASILVGICAAPLWTAQCSYFTLIGARYARVNQEPIDTVVSRFFGIFFMFFQISSITGSIISSTVLRPTVSDTDINDTLQLQYCGGNDCPWNNVSNSNLEKPDSTTVWTLLGIYIGIACLAVLTVALFADNLRKEDLIVEEGTVKRQILKNLIATFSHLRHIEQWLLIPLTMYSGFEQAFYSAEFSKSFVSCSLGIWKVGLVTLPFGICNAIMSFAGGHITKYVGRPPLFLFGLCLDLCTQFTLMFWYPTPDQEFVLYIISGMWGLTDGIWQTQINTLYGVVFAKETEAAFSNYRMWESLGFIVAFAYSTYLCTVVKLYVLTAVLGAGMLGYFIIEYVHRFGYKKSMNVHPLAAEVQSNAFAKEQTNSSNHSRTFVN